MGGLGTSYGITAASGPPLPDQHDTFGSLVLHVPFGAFAGGVAVPLRLDLSAGGFGVAPSWAAGTDPGPTGTGIRAGLASVQLFDAAGNDVTDQYRVRTTLHDVSAGAPLAPVPEPAAVLLVGTGALAVALLTRRRSKPPAA